MSENKQLNENNETTNDKMVQGTFWMTFGSIFSRLIGALYIIPWNALMGSTDAANTANALYSIGYTPYQLFLSIGIAGFPAAMSKQVAQYNAKNQYRTGIDIFQKSMYFMVFTGVISSALMYLLAPMIAQNSPAASVADGTMVIRALAPALLLVPALSLMRGFFQGYQDMVPSAISQVIEQIARVLYLLGATYIVMSLLDGNIANAVAHSTFAAFIGAIAATIVLLFYYKKQMSSYQSVIATSEPSSNLQTTAAIKSMLKESIPFIIIGSGITFAKMIDQVSFKPMMESLTNYSGKEIEDLFGLFSFNSDKLIMIIVSLAVGMATAAVPLIAAEFTKGNFKVLQSQIREIIQLFAFIMLPASLGMMIVSEPIYNVFYPVHPDGPAILAVSALMSIVLGLFTVLGSILQSLSKHKTMITYLLIGLAVKAIVQYPMLALFDTAGALIATTIGFFVTSVLSGWKIYQMTHFGLAGTLKKSGKILLVALLMALCAYIALKVSMAFIPVDRKIYALLVVMIVAAVGGIVYLGLTLKLRIADDILGKKAVALRRKLHIK
ncbi:polysaccharide biosynthesis protein [Trichococcus palustris]|jgi:O-antigen/teichoic acid export membrane protein|uniref:Polysaccharide biosynthesis protein n=1 Tax=Trichococcus palustris TaxID=140314 RepID=A0A143YGL3_9LACT|nr:polysaccharide biosynthesis protein [Trichococcus palustris]CZQ87860.1 polysaccharide biosynthesis protein [Trichococcus palustris]SFK77661.1 Membrane protein involved in the export of O-antigen and teichoic acid [Trichococcus palustris]